MKTIKENMDAFQKQMWSDPKPIEFRVRVVEELLLEVQRQRTVMRAALEEIDAHWETHTRDAKGGLLPGANDLVDLMDNLGYRQNGMYPKFLSPEAYEEYLGRLHSELDFAKIAEDIENGEE